MTERIVPLKRITSPAAPGNTLALKHGTYSPAAIAAQADRVHDALLEVAPWCNQPEYLPSVRRYLDATAREQMAHRAIEASPDKVSPRLLEAATAASRLAWQMGDALGLTPSGHAKLKTLTAASVHAEVGLADLIAQGRTARLEAEATSASQAAQPPPEALDRSQAITGPDRSDGALDGDL